MKIFKRKINGHDVSFVCQFVKTRNGFKHTCDIDGVYNQPQVKCTYQNRTWESYTFQTVLHKAIDTLGELNDEQKKRLKAYFDKRH